MDANGHPVDVSALAGPSGLVLIVFRSARRCRDCRRRLEGFRDAEAGLVGRGYRLAAVSRDSAQTLAAMARRWEIPFPLLSDRAPVSALPLDHRLPTVLVLTPNGVVQAKLAGLSGRNAPGAASVVAAIDALPRCMTPSVRQRSAPTTCAGRPRS